ncbi:3-deoxy-7-phosphoheptulonate synthase [soil metagenome]
MSNQEILETDEKLQHHWMLDQFSSHTLAEQLNDEERRTVQHASETLSFNATVNRDFNRALLGQVITNNTAKKIAIVGPCSFDEETDPADIIDLVGNLQDRHPNTLVAARINGAKPRTKGGWTGLWSGSQTSRQILFDAIRNVAEHNIPVVTEVTEPMQFGALAPMISGFWLGARDVTSTALRKMASATLMPVGLKNGTDGKPDTLEHAINAIGLATPDTNSGVDLGTVASGPFHRGVATGVLPVSEGNTTLGIIARGHEIVGSVTPEERREQTLGHLGSLCSVAVAKDIGVLIDGSHDVPPMLQISRTEPDRFPRVMELLLEDVENGNVENSHAIQGVMCEIGPHTGRTDPNWIINNASLNRLSEILSRVEEL